MQPNFIVTTATIPEVREHRYFQLDSTLDDPEVLERINKGVAAKEPHGDKSATNRTRLMRLGGTVNYPSNSKKPKGELMNSP